MSFRPKPNEEITIGDQLYQFAEHPNAPGIGYGQTGRRGTVYQLVDQKDQAWALKVFLRQFREPRLVGQAERIQNYAQLPGLRACEREVLTSSHYVDLIRSHTELAYGVLMPWIEGATWMEHVLGKDVLEAEIALTMARSLVKVLLTMEERGLAHCDISGSNVILTSESKVELVDLEEMFVSGLLQPPQLPGGSPGYAHITAPEGLWRPDADRFAGAIMLVEFLGWRDERIVEGAWGESFFDPDEVQKNCERIRLMKAVLQERWGSKLAELLHAAWFSDTLSMCPTFTEWLAALPEVVRERVTELDIKDVQDLVVQQEEDQWTCSVCGQRVSMVVETCPHCEQGKRGEVGETPTKEEEQIDTWKCDQCGREVSKAHVACPYCEGSGEVESPERKPEMVDAKPRVRMWLWVVLVIVVGLLGIWLGGGYLEDLGEERVTQAAAVAMKSTESAAQITAAIYTNTPTITSPSTSTATDAPTLTPTLGIGSTMVSDVDGMVLMYVPAGTFLMGSTSDDPNAADNEIPQHEVYLDAYWIDQTEVTNAMFVVFLNDEGNQIEGGKTWLDANDKSVRIEESDGVWRAVDGYGEHPVTVVTWYGARAYCVWAERRLPTEAEWEKAARGTDVMIYPWGDESPTCNLANYSGCEGKTDIVGIRLDGSSPYGAFDMAGNVWEWVADWYDHDYYETSPSRNPQGPSLGEGRVLRSSAWTNHPWALRTTYRSGYTPNVTYVDIGFRCGLGASQ